MDFEDTIKMLEKESTVRLVRFISEKGTNSCKACLANDGKIFSVDDPQKPELPIHPNCRCRYEELSENEAEIFLKKVHEAEDGLESYATQIATLSMQMLEECEESVKGHSPTYAAGVAPTALPIASYAAKIENIQREIEEKTASMVEKTRHSINILSLQLALKAMLEIERVSNLLNSKIKITGMGGKFNAGGFLNAPVQKIELFLKQLHYERLNNPLQHQSALPKNPAEAEKRGFVRAPDEQNLYHRHKGQRNNVKYHHPETGQEIIFNADGKIVTDIENIGTYNYFPPTGVANNFLHVLFDVVPYYKWGNSEEDTTPLGSRLLGPEKGPAVDLFLSVFKFIHDVKKYFVLSE